MTLYLSLVTCYQTIQQSRRRIWVSFSSVFLNFKPISRSLLERCITGYCIGLVAIAHALRYWSWTVVDGRCRRESWCASKGSCLRLRDIVGCSYSVPRFEFVASRSICFGRERTAGEKNLTKKKQRTNWRVFIFWNFNFFFPYILIMFQFFFSVISFCAALGFLVYGGR